jgi:hypothetical protein
VFSFRKDNLQALAFLFHHSDECFSGASRLQPIRPFFSLFNGAHFADFDLFGLKSLCAVVRIAHADGE